MDLDTDRNIDFEENSPYKEGIILEMYKRPDKLYIQVPTELKDLIDTTKLIQKFLPKQTDIDKILDIAKSWKVPICHLLSKKYKLPTFLVPISKIYTYIWLRLNLPSKKSAICKVENLAERFILLDSLLFKIVTTPEKENSTISHARNMYR